MSSQRDADGGTGRQGAGSQRGDDCTPVDRSGIRTGWRGPGRLGPLPPPAAGVLIAVLLVMSILPVTLGVVAHPERALEPDSLTYLELARNLADHGVFGTGPGGSRPELARSPGYPAFVALFQPWRSEARLRTLLMIQLGLLLVTAGWLARAVMLGGGSAVGGLVAALLLLLNPIAPALALSVLSESLFLFLCAAAAMVYLGLHARRPRAAAAISGFLTGAAILVRPIGLVLVPAVLWAGFGSWRRARRPLLFWLAFTALLPVLWVLRNGLGHEYWGLTRTPAAYLHASFVAPDEGSTPFERAARGVGRVVEGIGRVALGPGEWTLRRVWRGESGSRMGMAPPRTVRIERTDGGMRFVAAPGVEPAIDPAAPPAGAAALPARRPAGAMLLIAWSWASTLVLYLGAGRGLRPLWRSSRLDRRVNFALAAAFLLMMVAAGGHANARFRLPAIPWLAWVAGRGHARPLASPPRTGA